MAYINSVLGPIDTKEIGFTLMHEHVITCGTGISQEYPELLGSNFMDRLIHNLIHSRNEGIDTILDAGTYDLGRNVSVLAEASRRSGINILATTGWLHDPERFIGDNTPDRFAELFIREIKVGISGTGIKPAILKTYADKPGVTPAIEFMHRAIARAHKETNVPILLHSYAPGEVGRQQLAVLKDEGVDLNRVKIDHCLDTNDTKYLTWLLEQGCYLGMERCPVFNMNIKDQVNTIKFLIDAGWSHRLLPSHDYLLIRYIPELPRPLREHIATNCDPYKFLFYKKVMFPLLIEAGVQEGILHSLFTDNPRNFFEGVS